MGVRAPIGVPPTLTCSHLSPAKIVCWVKAPFGAGAPVTLYSPLVTCVPEALRVATRLPPLKASYMVKTKLYGPLATGLPKPSVRMP